MSKQTNKQLRDYIFDGPASKPESEVVEIDGKRFECRAPTMRKIMQWGDDADIADLLIGQVFNPDTGEDLFDESMRDSLLNLPMNSPIVKLSKVVGSLAAGNVKIEGLEEEGEDSGNE